MPEVVAQRVNASPLHGFRETSCLHNSLAILRDELNQLAPMPWRVTNHSFGEQPG